jgi:hypothetical protein
VLAPVFSTCAKFVELAQARMNRAIKAIRLIGKLDGRRGYYDQNDLSLMAQTLDDEIKAMGDRLETGLEGEPDFRLGEGGEGEA